MSQAFDKVKRQVIIEALADAGASQTDIELVASLHRHSTYVVKYGSLWGSFRSTTGIKQGSEWCFGSSTLRLQTKRVPLVPSEEPGIIRIRAPGSLKGLIDFLVHAGHVSLNLRGGGHPLSAEYAMRSKTLTLRVLHTLRKEQG